jgi:hypothetical protein
MKDDPTPRLSSLQRLLRVLLIGPLGVWLINRWKS